MYNDVSGTKLTQLEHILRTYVMYNFDLGNVHVCALSERISPNDCKGLSLLHSQDLVLPSVPKTIPLF